MCVDTDLCDKIDTLNTSVQTLISNQTNDNGVLFTSVENMSMWLQALVLGLCIYFIYKAVVRNIL